MGEDHPLLLNLVHRLADLLVDPHLVEDLLLGEDHLLVEDLLQGEVEEGQLHQRQEDAEHLCHLQRQEEVEGGHLRDHIGNLEHKK